MSTYIEKLSFADASSTTKMTQEASLLKLEELYEPPDDDTPYLAIPPYIWAHRYPEFVPDHQDMVQLAYSYLEEAIHLYKFNIFTGNSEKAWKRETRFNIVAKHLGDKIRQSIIDEIERKFKQNDGDDWELFKYSCCQDLWSTPADPAALMRIAETVPDDLSFETAGDAPGVGYISLLMELREAKKTGILPTYRE